MTLIKGNLLAETLTVDLFLMEANRKLSATHPNPGGKVTHAYSNAPNWEFK